jgi:hypothetical protein
MKSANDKWKMFYRFQQKGPTALLSDGADSFGLENRLEFFFRVYSDLHPLKYLHILIC